LDHVSGNRGNGHGQEPRGKPASGASITAKLSNVGGATIIFTGIRL